MTETMYHIYVNDRPVKVAVPEEEFQKEYQYIEAFLELTNLTDAATIDYVRCEPPAYAEASY